MLANTQNPIDSIDANRVVVLFIVSFYVFYSCVFIQILNVSLHSFTEYSNIMDVDSISDSSDCSPLSHLMDDENTLRKRNPWTLVTDGIDLLADVDALDEEEEDGVGCPLPSTPEDNQLLEAEVSFLFTQMVHYFNVYAYVDIHCINHCNF